MTIVGLYPGNRLSSPPSKTVNVFDLTLKDKGMTSEISEINSAKEKAARITLCVVLSVLILTAISLLLGEAFGLQWAICSKPSNITSQEMWYHWPWNWKHEGPSLTVSESYQERWNTLSLSQKRKELFRSTLGEVDLYDVYEDIHSASSDDNI